MSCVPVSGSKEPYVLYADDIPTNRKILGHRLNRIGINIVCVSDGSFVVTELEKNTSVKIVVLDEHMKEMHGRETAKKI